MSTRGRKADPREIQDALTEVPEMPESLNATMLEEWKTVAGDLVDRKLLTEAMLGSVESYVRARWNERLAQRAIDEHGVLIKSADESLKQNPACSLLGKSQAIIIRLSAELGLTPASRARGGMAPKEQDDDLLSLFDM
ncbi:phage terminase small subunit P27 family [Martelella mediterranea]|uniref:Putative phage terminase, small subunit, P27 family n=1 Tax=Martelella mediterranea DSM 17316 TaxID=1122214 RepID=A0A1U9YYL0_9HYPH|nr:phage terminase small subunit P27 family [Martelella mediterranea]AQZ50527.1 putative phage terminase, small subunit, P27 family [Martelella mediterranea DSM 17316]